VSAQCRGCGAYLAYGYAGEHTVEVDSCSRCIARATAELEKQLAHQKELLKEVVEVVRSAAFMQTIDGALNARDRARAILPKLEAELEENI